MKLFATMLLLASNASAFSIPKAVNIQRTFDPLEFAESPKDTTNHPNTMAKVAATAAAAFVAHPLVAFAEEAEVDDYEYGAVNAPIGIAWAAGTALIATSLLPLLLQGGEEAFEEMKEQDKGTFGRKNGNVLDKRNNKGGRGR